MPKDSTQRRRILVVEDDPDTREYLRDLLTASSFDVDVAADADGARTLALSLAPHALVLDLSLPRESGCSLLRDLRARGVDVPTVLVTAHPHPPDELDGRKLLVIAKPFRAEELIGALERELGKAA